MALFKSDHAHHKNILATMNGLRKQKCPCDVYIKVGRREVRAQRCVLMAAGDFFSSMLTRIDSKDKNHYIDVSPTTLDVCSVESVINYLYSGEISINNDNLESIIKVASLFLRTDIKNFCCKFMLDNLNWKTSMYYNLLAMEYEFPIVQQQNATIVKSRFHPSVISDVIFQNLSPEELKFLVSSCDIFENCDVIQVLNFLWNWVRSGISDEHEQAGSDILRYVLSMADTEALDSFTQAKLNESTFEETFENVVLLLKCKLKVGTDDVLFTNPRQNVKDTESKEIISLEVPNASDPDKYSEFPCQLDLNGNAEHVDSDALITKSVLSTDNLHQNSVDKDNGITKGECQKQLTEKPLTFNCDICNKRFMKLERLNVHKQIHTSKRLFKCSVCQKKFTLKKYLHRHMTVHKTDAKYACLFCEKRFKWKESLGYHMVLHTGHTQHFCTICTKPFAKLSQLNIHMLKHSEAKLSCEICGKKYKYKSDLKIHVEKHKRDKVFRCDTCGWKHETCQALKDHIKLHEDKVNTSNDFKRKGNVESLVQAGAVANNDMVLPDEKACSSADNDQFSHFEQNPVPASTDEENLMAAAAKTNGHENHSYLCQICFKTFWKKQSLNIHVKLHTKARPFDCVVCGNKFKTKPGLKQHMISHSTERPHCCELCQKWFKTKETISSHMLTHNGVKRHKCKDCSKSFTQSGHLKVHMLKHCSERSHVCKICRKMYKHKGDLKAHEEAHTKDKIFTCDTCGLSFETQQTIQEHVKMHEGVIYPSCQIKNEIETFEAVNTVIVTDTFKSEIETFGAVNTFMGTDTIKSEKETFYAVNTVMGTDKVYEIHENKDAYISENIKEENGCSYTKTQTHAKDSKFNCGSCDKHFTTQHYLNIHLKTHSTDTPYDCVICKQKFKLKHYLKRHTKRHHCDVPDVCYRCSICQRQFREKALLTTHMLYNDGIKRHFCTICKKGFIVKSALTNHMKVHNSDGERTLPCQICYKYFRDNAALKRHMLTHKAAKPNKFICEICGLEYGYESSLRLHKRSMHTQMPEKFQCDGCSRTFKVKGALTKHKETHTDIKQFICPTCGKQFRRNSNLAAHILIHSDVKPYSCEDCSCHFRDKSSLLRHSRIHSGEKTHCCKICDKYFTRAENLRGHMSRFHP